MGFGEAKCCCPIQSSRFLFSVIFVSMSAKGPNMNPSLQLSTYIRVPKSSLQMIRVVYEKAIFGNMSTSYYCVTFFFKLLNLPQNQDGSNKRSLRFSCLVAAAIVFNFIRKATYMTFFKRQWWVSSVSMQNFWTSRNNRNYCLSLATKSALRAFSPGIYENPKKTDLKNYFHVHKNKDAMVKTKLARILFVDLPL